MGNKPSSTGGRSKQVTSTGRRSVPIDPTRKQVKWSEANQDILLEISNRIISIEDFISFRGVCKSWRSSTTTENFNRSPLQIKLPWLMVETYTEDSIVQKFFSCSTGSFVHRKIIPRYNPDLDWRLQVLHFESQGWLIIVEHNFLYGHIQNIYFEHPTQPYVKFDVPRVVHHFDGSHEDIQDIPMINKVILSTHETTSPDFVIVISCSNSMLSWRPGAKAWNKFYHKDSMCYNDVVFSYNKEQLYILESQTIYRCKFEGLPLVTKETIVKLPEKGYRRYLVEPSSNDMLFVVCLETRTKRSRMTMTRFSIFQVDLRKGTCDEVSCLGDKAIFCGFEFKWECDVFEVRDRRSACTLVKASGVRGIKANCIYFKSKSRSSGLPFICSNKSDIGLYYYNLEDGRFYSCRPRRWFRRKKGNNVPVTFITPTFS